MKSLLPAVMMLSLVTSGAFAADGEALFKKYKCDSCHKLESKSVGPHLKEIAAKYANNKDAPATLEKKVRNGGSGVWGNMPMIRAPSSVSDEDIRVMVAWMLTH